MRELKEQHAQALDALNAELAETKRASAAEVSTLRAEHASKLEALAADRAAAERAQEDRASKALESERARLLEELKRAEERHILELKRLEDKWQVKCNEEHDRGMRALTKLQHEENEAYVMKVDFIFYFFILIFLNLYLLIYLRLLLVFRCFTCFSSSSALFFSRRIHARHVVSQIPTPAVCLCVCVCCRFSSTGASPGFGDEGSRTQGPHARPHFQHRSW